MSNYGTETFIRSLRGGDPPVFVFGVPTAAALATVANGGASRLNNVVTFTTKAAHNFVPGQALQALGTGATGNTSFDGNYIILTVPTTTTLTAQPTDPTGAHQANDTGGGGNITSIAAEQPAVLPQASIAVALADIDAHNNEGLSLEVFFTGAPGNFEIDLQEADTNTDSAFQTASGGNAKLTAVSANNTGRIDATNIVAKFVRINLASRTNNVGIVARLSR